MREGRGMERVRRDGRREIHEIHEMEEGGMTIVIGNTLVKERRKILIPPKNHGNITRENHGNTTTKIHSQMKE